MMRCFEKQVEFVVEFGLRGGSTLVEEEGVGLVVGLGKEAVVKVGEQAL